MPPKVSAEESARITRLIFGRWVEQQLKEKQIKVKDVITDMSDGNLVIDLLETLAEKKFTGKRNAAPKLRAHKIDNINAALQFAFGECAVELKIKPSAEDFVDSDERNVLGFIWAIMLKYIRLDDMDEEDGSASQLNAKDALLMWVRQKTAGYAGVEIKSFATSFTDGLALAAILHKHRPKLIEFSALSAANPDATYAAVIAAASKYFGHEAYLQPSDIPKLDEKCMVVFVADFYMGIAEQRKLDLAARRIGKVIKLTEENDKLRADYTATADDFVAHVSNVVGQLEDRTIDDTMAGAKARLEAFYKYKGEDKGAIIDRHLACEGLYNQLAMRLVQHKRPAFVPKAGCTLADLAGTVKHLEECEAERQVALHKELNRQIRLAQLEEQHVSRHGALETWYMGRQAFLADKVPVDSISEAILQLRLLDGFDKESAGQQETSVTKKLLPLGAELVAERFERSAEVQQREQQVADWMAELTSMSVAKRPVLEEDLRIEEEKERLRLEFAQSCKEFLSWTADAAKDTTLEHFGFDLEEVEAYQATITSSRSDIQGESDAKLNPVKDIKAQMDALNVTHNRYTETTVDDLDAAVATLMEAYDARDARFEVELERQRENDRLCREFAGLVDPLAQWIDDQKAQISNAKSDLDSQLAHVEAKIASGNESADGAKLVDIRSLNATMESRNITDNKHTRLGVKDIEVAWSQYVSFLARKKEMLEHEIEHQKLRGVTPEQFAEIDENFKMFDADKSNTIEKRELRACLYSLGEEKKPNEVQAVLDSHGNGKSIAFEGFREFMITVLGDTDTKEEILDGFKLINRGGATGDVAKMELVMTDYDLNYVKRTAPAAAGGLDYHAWTEDVFSR